MLLFSRKATSRLGQAAATSACQPIMTARPRLAAAANGVLGQPPAARRHFVEASVEAAQSLITGMHTATGTPWFVTIPLIALPVALIRLPLGKYSLRIARMRQSASRVIQVATVQGVRLNKSGEGTIPKMGKATRQVSKRLGLQVYKLYAPLLTLPIWLIVTESLRRLSGAGFGLVGLFFRGREGAEAPAASPEALPSPLVSDATSSSLDVSSLPMVDPSIEATAAIAEAAASTAPGVDLSLTTGGCLWFPNLMEADPYHILPLLLSAVLLQSVLAGRNRKARDMRLYGQEASGPGTVREVPRLEGMQQIYSRTIILMAMLSGPLTIGLPSAIHLYWLSSLLINKGLNAAQAPLPSKPPLRACKGVPTLVSVVLPRPGGKITSKAQSN